MDCVVAVYRSRNVALRVYSRLEALGVTCSVISTPRSANVGCGLSVKFSANDLGILADRLRCVETFVGFFRVVGIGGKTVVTRL